MTFCTNSSSCSQLLLHLLSSLHFFSETKVKEPNFTLKRTFRVENTGLLPITIRSAEINGQPCEGYGFKVLSCQEFALKPNASKDLIILWVNKWLRALIDRECFAVSVCVLSPSPTSSINTCPQPLWLSKPSVRGWICSLPSGLFFHRHFMFKFPCNMDGHTHTCCPFTNECLPQIFKSEHFSQKSVTSAQRL